MIGEIIAIGDELVSGRILNTTSSFAASRLFSAGHLVRKITIVGDDPKIIRETLLEAITKNEFVIVSGGLGPTTDDITNESVSKALGLPLEKNSQVEKQIKEMEARFGEHAPDQFKRKLIMLPKGAKVLNPNGHAAGYELNYSGVYLFFLPGVPEQLHTHLIERVLPRLNDLDKDRPYVFQQVFKLFGLTETEINMRLEEMPVSNRHVKFGYYPVFPEVHVSITVTDKSKNKAEQLLQEAARTIRTEFEKFIVAEDDDGSLPATLGQLLKSKNFVLSAAESCTGGMLGETVTSVAGSSDWFDRVMVTYSNKAKMDLLGVSPKTLERYGAVSRQTALEMVQGVRKRAGSQCALAITGIAGPGGGSPEKPVGTVFISMSVEDTYLVHRFLFPGTRQEVRKLTVETALDWLRRFLKYGSLLPGYKPVD